MVAAGLPWKQDGYLPLYLQLNLLPRSDFSPTLWLTFALHPSRPRLGFILSPLHIFF